MVVFIYGKAKLNVCLLSGTLPNSSVPKATFLGNNLLLYPMSRTGRANSIGKDRPAKGEGWNHKHASRGELQNVHESLKLWKWSRYKTHQSKCDSPEYIQHIFLFSLLSFHHVSLNFFIKLWILTLLFWNKACHTWKRQFCCNIKIREMGNGK